ncbi:fad fmn-containing isoamyl alcohol oxidase [Trichoderma cornu-damae]|uniref:Fad fmn-containing isoamyl alcohol oxidase n=1 Tax=Trichoderma cornu-damae TaxID=654480 RepID=A0A9P8QJ64_9HYPO|nr:fad fmn-containing isoamyl alcohol oxidase [Trichoderma cornu-damae]
MRHVTPAMLRIALICLLLLRDTSTAFDPSSSSSSSSSSSPSPPSSSSVGVPLFGYETVRLTDDSLRHIRVPPHLSRIFSFDTAAPAIRPGECKPLPGDANWPSEEEWAALNDALGGEEALIKTVPLAAPCYKEWQVYDEDRCEELERDWADPWSHEDDATSVMSPIWQGLTCLPPNIPASSPQCTLGGYPSYAINATTVSHVQLGVNFARNKGIRLVIKNTGHDSLGKSCGAGALSIWTRHLQELEYLAGYEHGAFGGPVLHVGSGVRTRDVYEAAEERGCSVVGGMCESVGFSGGYFAGGGHSALSSLLGAAADHILAVNIVTADGRFRTVTEETYPDLFWAIRGGGGGTFGITTSVIVKLHEKLGVTTSQIAFRTSDAVSDDTFWLGVRAYFESFERHGKAGCYAYFTLLRNEDGASYSMSIQSIVAPNTSLSAFDAITSPFFTRLNLLNIPYRSTTKHYSSVLPALREAWPRIDGVADFFGIRGSRFFPAQIWTDPSGFGEAFAAIRQVSRAGYPLAAWQMAPGNPTGADNAVNPAFRHALAFFSAEALFPDAATPAEKTAIQSKLLAEVVDPWRAAAPTSENGGSYLSLGNLADPNWRGDFYGEGNYEKLKQVKKQWDPSSLFYATTGVDSDEWEVRTEEQGIQTQNGPLCRRRDGMGISQEEGYDQVVFHQMCAA